MSDEYKGIKFKVKFLGKKETDDKLAEKLISYCKKFAKKGLCPKYEGGSCGNLSFRTEEGFIITGAHTDLESIKKEDLVLVSQIDRGANCLGVIGLKEPSSEAMLHAEIYIKRDDVNAIFHGHSDLNEEFPCTEEEKPYGSQELIVEVKKILKRNKIILMKNHGFLSLGKNMDEASKQVLK